VRRLFRLVGRSILLAALLAGPVPAEDARPASFLDLEARRLVGGVEPLADYRGQVLLVVNTASKCGFTPQYEALEALYERYRERGFSVLGFPSNDFREQEPGDDAEIGAFCKENYGVEFPMFSKVHVRGDDVHPVYLYLTSLPEPVGGPVQWNFQKYLVDRSGRVVQRFSPPVWPDSEELVAAIERLLEEPAPAPPSARLP
jgi:glutathione peroxidase